MSEKGQDVADVERFWRQGGVMPKVRPGEFTAICGSAGVVGRDRFGNFRRGRAHRQMADVPEDANLPDASAEQG